MALRKKATTEAAAPAEAPATEAAAPATPAAKPAKPAKGAKPAATKKAAKSAEKPNWLVARLRNAVAKNFDEDSRKAFKEAAKGASSYEGIKEAAGVDDAEWAQFIADFFNNGGKAPE